MTDVKSLYDLLVNYLAVNHCKFKGKGNGYADLLRFDLDKRKIYNGNTVLMDNGEWLENEIELVDGQRFHNLKMLPLFAYGERSDNVIADIEEKYIAYKTSVPSKHTSFSKLNFKAKIADELSLRELVNGVPRVKAQYALESYVMFCGILGLIPWENPKHFYWQSQVDRDLVVFRNWCIK